MTCVGHDHENGLADRELRDHILAMALRQVEPTLVPATNHPPEETTEAVSYLRRGPMRSFIDKHGIQLLVGALGIWLVVVGLAAVSTGGRLTQTRAWRSQTRPSLRATPASRPLRGRELSSRPRSTATNSRWRGRDRSQGGREVVSDRRGCREQGARGPEQEIPRQPQPQTRTCLLRCLGEDRRHVHRRCPEDRHSHRHRRRHAHARRP
jgi:hypothetical protein